MSKIILTGGSGYLGLLLARHFSTQGHEVVVVSRTAPRLPAGVRHVPWNAHYEPDLPWVQEVDGADLVINLAGKSVNCRYTQANRREILQSRLTSTAAVARAIYCAEEPPPVWMNASSATIYRDSRDQEMDETNTEFGTGFSENVVHQWESLFFNSALPEEKSVRRIALRIPIVFGPEAPVMQVYSQLARIGLGGPQGDGGQFVSWLHEIDFLHIVDFLWEHEELDGPVNLSTPRPLTNAEFMEALREAYGKPVGVWTPALAMQIGAVFLNTEAELVLKSRRVLPRKLLEAGFRFQFSTWAGAVKDIAGQ